MVRTKTKPFLKRKKVPKFYFHFFSLGSKKSVLPSLWTYWRCENITASPCGFPHQYNLPPRYNWNIVDSGVKYYNPNPNPFLPKLTILYDILTGDNRVLGKETKILITLGVFGIQPNLPLAGHQSCNHFPRVALGWYFIKIVNFWWT